MNKRITSWLLVTVFLTGCAGSVEPSTDGPTPPTDAVTLAAIAEPTLSTDVVAAATTTAEPLPTAVPTATPTELPWSTDPDPLQIEQMRQRSYPGSPITIEETLGSGANYNQYVVSYLSDGYKIYALMTIPHGEKPDTGWPVIVFNHGYIAPDQYRTTERYVAYANAIASNGYIVFKSDYRGHGDSEGGPEVGGGYGTPDYTVDVLNAIAALKTYEDADPDRIGMWGHSMGGQITLRAMVVSQDIKAGVIWGGVVAPYPDVIERWDFSRHFQPTPDSQSTDSTTEPPPGDFSAGRPSGAFRWGGSFGGWVQEFSTKYGTAEQNPDFWATISPNTYLADLSGPIQLHHSITDRMVPLAWSETLVEGLDAVGNRSYEFYTYPDDDHDISANFVTAMELTVAFFDVYVKNQ